MHCWIASTLTPLSIESMCRGSWIEPTLTRSSVSEEIAASVMHGLFAFDLVKSRLHALGNDVASDASDVAEEYEAFQRWYHREHPDLHLRWLTWREGNKKNYKNRAVSGATTGRFRWGFLCYGTGVELHGFLNTGG